MALSTATETGQASLACAGQQNRPAVRPAGSSVRNSEDRVAGRILLAGGEGGRQLGEVLGDGRVRVGVQAGALGDVPTERQRR
jgi:hypothetical protein